MYYSLNAIVLKKEDFRDNDIIATVYSPEKGKLTLQARGAKHIKSKLSPHLEPLSLSFLNVTNGRQFDQLIGAQSVSVYSRIHSSYSLLSTALSSLSLYDRFIFDSSPDYSLYALLSRYLDFLDRRCYDDENKISLSFLVFQARFLYFLGHGKLGNYDDKLTNFGEDIIKEDINFLINKYQSRGDWEKLKRVLMKVEEDVCRKR